MSAILKLISPVSKMYYTYEEVLKLLPEEYKGAMRRDDSTHTNTATRLFIWLIAQAGHHLDPSCANVLKFLIARTYGYHKRAELVSIRQLIEGVWEAKNDESICAPAVRDERTARKAISVLEKVGYITRVRVTINNADVISFVSVNAERILADNFTKGEAMALRVSKKYKGREEALDAPRDGEFFLKAPKLRGVQTCSTPALQKCSTNNIKKEEYKKPSCSIPRNALRVTRKPREEGNAIDCKSSAKDAVAKAVARVTSKREEKAARAARASFPTLVELNALWQSVVIAAFGTCTVSGMTHKEYGIFKRVAKPHSLSCSWKTFFEWVVDNWGAINNESKEIAAFKKSKGDWSLKEDDRIFLGSEAPDIFMMSRNFGKLVKRYAQHSLNGRTVKAQESAEVIQLRKAAEEARKEAQLHKSLLKKVMAAPNVEPMRKERKPVKLVDPETDTFFDDIDSSLPEWK